MSCSIKPLFQYRLSHCIKENDIFVNVLIRAKYLRETGKVIIFTLSLFFPAIVLRKTKKSAEIYYTIN